MKLPLSWLKEFVDINLPIEKIGHLLTLAGLEVERIEKSPLPFEGIIAAKVLKTEPHKDAEKLVVATVSDGNEELQIVCGAPNCRPGLITALAPIGSKLFSPDGKLFKIKKTKLRGVHSFGMLCSGKELGLSDDHEGLIALGETVPLGTDLSTLFGDTVLDLFLTPNLGHCMSVLGIARELAAHMNVRVKEKSCPVKETGPQISKSVAVKIEDSKRCLSYNCRLIKDISVAPSPKWLKERLEHCGIRSVNNVVDSTNYVMLEVGQPLHAFSWEKVGGKTLFIKTFEQEKVLKTLDEKTVKAPANTLFICDGNGPLAVAGVMGGKESEVTEHTKHILLESAHFCPTAVRKASKTLGLRTESSSRFEKGIDPEGVIKALDQAAMLIKKLAGGEVLAGIASETAKVFKPKVIAARLSKIEKLLGISIPLNEAETFLKRLEMQVVRNEDNPDIFKVTPPSYRSDITSEIDLIEEIAKLYGYNNIPRKRAHYVGSALPHTPLFEMERELRSRLIAEGLQEFITCDLISPKLSLTTREKKEPKGDEIVVLRPSSVDQSILRTSLLPGLLESVKKNFDQQNFDISAFEIGRVHYKVERGYKERLLAAIILTGKRTPHHWKDKPPLVDFYDLKGIIENLLNSLLIKKGVFSPSTLSSFHPSAQATVKSGAVQMGAFGQVHPTLLKTVGIEEPLFFAELDLIDLLEVKNKEATFASLPIYPGSIRDWTVTLKSSLSSAHLLDSIKKAPSKLLKEITIVDLYKNPKLGSEFQNITLRFLYRDDKKTLKHEAVEKEHLRIIDCATQKLTPFLP